MLACWVACAALAVIYLPDVGHGFVKDDYAWIRSNQCRSASDVVAVFRADNGFYRPVVALSFAANHWLNGLAPSGYGLINALLATANAVLLLRLLRRFGAGSGPSRCAVLLWAFNPHGTRVALMWISGRTSLLLTLFALAAALAVAWNRPWLAGLATLLALLSKEEAVLLPVVLVGAALLWHRALAAQLALATVAALVAYGVLRAGTHAYLPGTAPAFYRLGAADLGRNALEYADRSCTLTAVALVVLCLAGRGRIVLERNQRRLVALGTLWLAAGYGLTGLLPVRSSLYAYFPTVGVAVVTAALAETLWLRVSARRRRRLLWLAMAATLALVPIYRARNARSVAEATLSRAALADLIRIIETAATPLGPDDWLVIRDGSPPRNLRTAFGTLLPDALRLSVAAPPHVWVEPPPPGWEEAGLEAPRGAARVRLRLRGERLEPE